MSVNHGEPPMPWKQLLGRRSLSRLEWNLGSLAVWCILTLNSMAERRIPTSFDLFVGSYRHHWQA